MGLSEIGNTASIFLQKIPELRPEVSLDEFMIMPNHLHCILTLKSKINPGISFNRFGKPVAGSVSMIINQFKGAVKKWCDRNGHGYFEWHTKFHDRIIRDYASYQNIVHYIRNNPANWK